MLIDEIRNGETDTLEFKRDVPSDKLHLLKTACAFANCNGGRIVVGVDDDRTIVGVDEMAAFRLADQLVDTISNGCEPLIPVSSEVAAANGKTLIVLSVQMGLHCPYHIKSSGVEKGTFVRVGATSRLADEDLLKELGIIGKGRCFDSMVCRGLDVSKTEIQRLCTKMYRLARENYDDDAERKKIRKVGSIQLEDWNILVRNGGKLLPSNAFALLIGAKKFHSEMKCGFFKGTTRAHFIDRKEFAGSILNQIDQAYEFVLAKINRGMEIVGTRRKDIYEIPPSVIRELIVNAVVHRLYINPRAMATTVAVYEDRVEVTSPGGLPHGMSLEMMATGHSRSRNKSLALAFKYMNFIEEWGSGIPRIQEMLSEAGLPPLGVENSGSDTRFTVWRRPIQQTVPAEVAPIKVQVAPKPAEVALMLKDKGRTDAIKNAVAVFRCLMEDGGVLVADIENQTHLSNGSVKNALRLLRMNGIIKRDGSNRNGRWVVLGEKGEWARSDEHDATEIGRL